LLSILGKTISHLKCPIEWWKPQHSQTIFNHCRELACFF
jgi:hypothetical protein